VNQDIETEKTFLGTLISEPQYILETNRYVQPEYFYRDPHKTIYSTLLRMAEAKRHIDIVTVAAELNGKIHDHSATLSDLLAEAGSHHGIIAYAEHIALLWRKRRFVELCGELSHVASNGSSPEKLDPLWKEAEAISRKGLCGIAQPLDLADIDKIMSVETVPFICEPFLAQDDVTIFGAMYGTGKSWTAYHLCFSICNGTPFMGHFPVTPAKSGPCIYFDFENPSADISRIIRNLTGGTRPPGFYLVHMPTFKIDTPDGLLTLQRYVDEIQPIAIVLDSLSKTHTKLETRPEQIGPVMYGLQCFARQNHIGILVLHHYGKETIVSKTPESRLRGSTAIGDNADAVFSLQTTKERTIVMGHEKSRHGKRTPPFEFAIEDTDGTPKTVLEIKTLEITAAATDRAKEIRSYIAASGAPKTKPMLYDEFVTKRQWNERTFRRAMRAALDKYLLVQRKDEKKVTWVELPPETEGGHAA